MKEFTNYFILAFIIFIIYLYFENKSNEVTYVISEIDNKKYLVRNLPDKNHAANLLANIRKKLDKLKIHLEKEYSDDPRTERLVKRFNPDAIVEAGANSKHTSYSINKGEKVVLCLRSRDENQNLEDENIVMFVVLHEISHIITKSIGHTQEFWDNFEFILKESVKINIYTHVDFNSNPASYCGVKITDSPLSN